jgi:hypothetical protein
VLEGSWSAGLALTSSIFLYSTERWEGLECENERDVNFAGHKKDGEV